MQVPEEDQVLLAQTLQEQTTERRALITVQRGQWSGFRLRVGLDNVVPGSGLPQVSPPEPRKDTQAHSKNKPPVLLSHDFQRAAGIQVPVDFTQDRKSIGGAIINQLDIFLQALEEGLGRGQALQLLVRRVLHPGRLVYRLDVAA